ncbi:hypothetical protein [Microbispora sp. H10836]|uniref:hypothetical protein n=1 Tax=Microbispora sp. H10836 TaxID=2729106 RepID=UPI001476235C|nr:hypothetical protein [Microbispora sp. H10836]
MTVGTISGAAAYSAVRRGTAPQGWPATAAEFALMTALLGGGRWAIRQSHRHRAKTLRPVDALPHDQEIVLFLRAFTDDEGFANVPRGHPHGPWAATTDTEEQQLAQATAPFGQMIALGKPGDALPQTGAGRYYAADHEWQTQVLAALDRARLVILACGPGRGLRWETERIVAFNRPERLVLVVARDADQYESFRAEMHDLFPKGLPRAPDFENVVVKGPDHVHIRAVVWFDGDWTPHATALGAADPEVRVHRLIEPSAWVRTAFPLAIRPVYQRAGLAIPGLPATRHTRPWQVPVALVLCALALVLLSAGTDGFDLSSEKTTTLLIFLGLPFSVLLYRTWCGGHISIRFVQFFGWLFGAVSFMVLVMPGTTRHPLVAGLLGTLSSTGALLLGRHRVREWVASLALVPPDSPRASRRKRK